MNIVCFFSAHIKQTLTFKTMVTQTLHETSRPTASGQGDGALVLSLAGAHAEVVRLEESWHSFHVSGLIKRRVPAFGVQYS